MQRGRKSAASNAVQIDVIGSRSRLTVPKYLTIEEQSLFEEIVAVCEHRQLAPTDGPLLASYVQAAIKARKLAAEPDKVSEWEKTVRVMAMLARSLRLTPQSRLDRATAGRMARDQKVGPLPWDQRADDGGGDDDGV